MSALPGATDIGRVVADVFSLMLNVNAVPLEKERPSEGEAVTGAIFFAGEPSGAVFLECSLAAATQFTRRLLHVDRRPDSLDADVRDSLGELANMIAGNLKSFFPASTMLSLPSVVAGCDYSVRVCRGKPVVRLPFDTEHGSFAVTLVVSES